MNKATKRALRRARLLLGDGIACYAMGVVLVSAPWRLGGDYVALIRTAVLVIVSIVLSLFVSLVAWPLRADHYRLASLLCLLVALVAGAVALYVASFSWSEGADAIFWSTHGADIRPEAVVGIVLCGLATLPLLGSMMLALRASRRAHSLQTLQYKHLNQPGREMN